MRKRTKLGDMLVEAGLLERSVLEDAIAAPDRNGAKLGQYLCARGLVREDQLVEMLSRQLRVPRYEPEKYPIEMEMGSVVPPDLAQRHGVVPLSRRNSLLVLGMSDPTDLDAFDAVERVTRCEVVPVICTERELNQLTNSIYGSFAGLGHMIGDGNGAGAVEEAREGAAMAEDVEVGSLADMASEAPVIRMVNYIVAQAVKEGASDIHISPEAHHVQLRYRVDGRLREVPAPPKNLHLPIVSRIKILAKLDIAVSRIPQDGRFTVKLDNREINIRVSTIPTTHGENVVLRLLDMGAFNYTVNDLGMCDRDRESLRAAIRRPYGMILSTGPTGSGKTTTLYAMLKELNSSDINIITVEDPVEYRIPKIRQVQLNTKAGMTFASGLRAILRQDPDVIMVGEIRDAETARIAVQASLTGHLVFSTVHTNDAAGAITRLVDMGIEPFLVSSTLVLSFAQRLIRKVCTHCAVAYEPGADELGFWGLAPQPGLQFKRAQGCPRCQQSGYQGRIGVFEVLMMDDEVKQLISHGATTLEINRAAHGAGKLRTLKEDAADKIRQGLTTPEEALSVVSE